MYKLNYLSVFLFTFLLNSCTKGLNQEYVPDVYVNINIFPSMPSYIDLNPIGGWMQIEGGSRGIIIYRLTNDDFLAFDRHCPYDVTNSCGKVNVNTNNLFAVDTCCGSQFLIVDGSVNIGPATLPLKRYNTSWDGNQLTIFN
ncbi:MAG: hypothetical protein HRT72_05520 [Flavobacteriales bacterium]|nr:hypothetical protein [Flavobacteriales bacterium]